MKKLTLSILILTTLIFSGCAGKVSNNTSSPSASSTSLTTSNSTAQSTNDTTNNSTAQVNLQPIKPNTLPKLSVQQKKQVDSKLSSTLKSLDNTLKSIQDPKDINLDSVN